MLDQQIITGIMSYGMSGRIFHAPFIGANPKFKLRAVVERTNKNAQVDYPDIISYQSIDDLLDDPEIELVVVNTPNDTHVAFAEKALRAGKHVLIEKPVAPTAKEAAYLFDLAERCGKLLLPYHNRRFDSDYQSLKTVIEGQRVGRPIELHIRFDRFKPNIGVKAFKEKKQAASGILYDLGSHLLDQVIALFGRPKSMTKIKGVFREDSVVDDYGSIILNYAGGLNVFITTSLLVANPQASFVLHGTKGSFVKERTDTQESQLLAGMLPTADVFGVEPENKEGLLTFENELKELETALIQSERGAYMTLFDEVYESIRNGKPYFVNKDQIVWQLEILEPSK
ncbi:oxidoreductase [Sphingobacterium sp. DK4209]|uniref:Oxidoreductase n=1 Tax=Sphingobacterium zhuxiongii TaxID=2662364 RepID=A0A5Q0Q6G5_9SPHI|nr:MULTISPECIES: Gfo/Idh/MocA family oxidoreductase [unclassified Sphingobacterium]MVZ64316.1 oxidoreductase [Sphingobacterium sp. DK4209]QGA25665.1 oxidoreductase [Sphingobacterium sp. dk4302]